MSGMSIISIDLFKESFWEVRVVVILGLIEETVKFVFFEELFFFFSTCRFGLCRGVFWSIGRSMVVFGGLSFYIFVGGCCRKVYLIVISSDVFYV